MEWNLEFRNLTPPIFSRGESGATRRGPTWLSKCVVEREISCGAPPHDQRRRGTPAGHPRDTRGTPAGHPRDTACQPGNSNASYDDDEDAYVLFIFFISRERAPRRKSHKTGSPLAGFRAGLAALDALGGLLHCGTRSWGGLLPCGTRPCGGLLCGTRPCGGLLHCCTRPWGGPQLGGTRPC